MKTQTLSQIFASIHDNHCWSGESVSGPGSSLEATKILRVKLNMLIRRYRIKSILDIGCGDLNWISKIDLTNVSYIGIDVVPNLIATNQAHFPNYNFYISDLQGNEPLPKTDLIICRDCLVHLTQEQAQKVLQSIFQSGSRYCLLTTFPRTPDNLWIETGKWFPYNLRLAPFNLPKPLKLIDEGSVYKNKMLGMWKIK